MTINVSKETKERFRKAKLNYSSKVESYNTEEEFMIILLDKFEGKNHVKNT
jgi:hypothetical protein